MGKRVVSILFIGLLFIFILCLVSAHNPRIVYDRWAPKEKPVIIENPEISQAFYGNLRGAPNYFLINSDKNFDFYVELLIPYFEEMEDPIENHKIDIYSFEENKTVIRLDGSFFEWKKTYEKFGGNWYIRGPNYGKTNLSQGSYLIEISNGINQGSYVFVIGKKEKWTPKEIINALILLPKLKKEFFWQPAWKAYFNLFGLYVLLFLLVIAVLIFFGFKYLRRKKKKNFNRWHAP